ncbi:MAG TPA: hypothetical protein PKK10_00540 [Woeseiaceae bacterium]|nr:hypothetical protein [Woeseiaceae bacterium]
MNTSPHAIKNGLLMLAILGMLNLTTGQPSAQATGNVEHPHRLSRFAPVFGTVELNGCHIRPQQLQIEASPFSISLGDPVPADGRPDRPLRALVWRTSDRHVFRFLLPALERSKLHQLRIAAPPNPCGYVFWRGPFEGFVSPGDLNVRIEGVAATSEIEVFDPVADEWTGAATFSLADASTGGATRSLRWRSGLSNVTSGELQLATSAFPTEGHFGACDEPASGIVLRADVPLDPDGWTDLGEFNFSTLFGQIFDPPDGDALPLAPTGAAAVNEASSGDGNTTPINAADRLLLTMGAPLYLRIIPKRVDGMACNLRADGVAGWAMLANDVGLQQVNIPPVPPPQAVLQAGNEHSYRPPFKQQDTNGKLIPGYTQRAYIVTKAHKLPPFDCRLGWSGIVARQMDPLGCALLDQGNAPGLELQRKQAFVIYPPSGGGGGSFNPLSAFTNTFGNLVTGIYTAVSYGVDALANLYDDIKKAVVNLALKGLTIPPFNAACAALETEGPVTCGAIIKTGIEVGLASMGMPPSLPNFEDLKDQGVEYLAAQIQSQTGIPTVIAEQALQIAKDAIEDMATKSGGSDARYNWVTPYLGIVPAYAEIVLTKNGSDPIPDNLLLLRKSTDLYEGAPVNIPSVFPPSGELRIPMLLRPNAAGITNPVCTMGPFDISCAPNLFASKPICRLGGLDSSGQIIYTERDCKTQGPFAAPNIYFRDEWLRQRYEPAACTSLSMVSKQSSGLGPLPPPPGFSFLLAAGFDPKQPRNWNGAFSFSCFSP